MHCRIPAAALSLATLAMTSACTPAPSPSPSGPVVVAAGPTASPSPLCLFESGGTPSPCTQAQFEELASKDSLYREAEQVYRKFLAEDERISRAGGLITHELELLVTGELATSSADHYKRGNDSRLRLIGPVVLEFIKRQPGKQSDGSLVALVSCVDSSAAELVHDGTVVGKGRKVLATSFYRQEEGVLKIVDLHGNVGDSVC